MTIEINREIKNVLRSFLAGGREILEKSAGFTSAPFSVFAVGDNVCT